MIGLTGILKKDQQSLREALENEHKQWGATGKFYPLKLALIRKMIQIESISK